MASKRVGFQNALEIFDAEVCHVKARLGNALFSVTACRSLLNSNQLPLRPPPIKACLAIFGANSLFSPMRKLGSGGIN